MYNAHVITYWAWMRYAAQRNACPLAETFFSRWHADEISAARAA